MTSTTAELDRLESDGRRTENWKRWGPYLSERQWGTVREDYSAHGTCWESFPHDHARSRVYRWGEDGLMGICDRQARLCLALALWNGEDPILKERLFGLTGPEGNHGEDVKELYYYLDSTPTHSYLEALYKYPQSAYPYERLVRENRERGRSAPEFELADTGAFDDDRYFDVRVEHAKASPEDLLLRVTVSNRGPEARTVHVLPQLWFRNTWSWGRKGEGHSKEKPLLERVGDREVLAIHEDLGRYHWFVEERAGAEAPRLLFTENESNARRLWGAENGSRFVKDAFHERVVHGNEHAVNPQGHGTKVAAWHVLEIPAGAEVVLRLRLTAESEAPAKPFGASFDDVLTLRRRESDAFHADLAPEGATDEECRVMRQANAGLLWSKQFYHHVVSEWIEGDPSGPEPPRERLTGRNHDWKHLYNRDVISMPDKWEYPWYAAWDLAFHALPLARLDPAFAKEQLVLFLREWYMHPNGQIPAYEFAFSDVNPPVHAWAAWRVYKMTGRRGQRDRVFLSRVFQKLLLNFNWWVNRKDPHGNHVFSGGFLGLDNIGVFDRSQPLPTGGHLEQADGTAWMAFYCATMLSMALELADGDPAAEDMASKFLEHFVAISDAMNTFGGTGLWDEQDGFYHDRLDTGSGSIPLRVRSLVGVIPLFAVEILDEERIAKLPGFRKRLEWFLENRQDLAKQIAYLEKDKAGHGHRLLAIPSRERLVRVLRRVLDEAEFLSPHGLRSVSKAHQKDPYIFEVEGREWRVDYVPGESNSGLFGGNSNWRGPIWFPLNYLMVEALQRYHHFYGESVLVECPTGSGTWLTLGDVANELARRLSSVFLEGASGARPCHGADARYATDPHFRDLLLFHEYFHGDDGGGLGASHQTGWTSLVVRCIEEVAQARTEGAMPAVPASPLHVR